MTMAQQLPYWLSAAHSPSSHVECAEYGICWVAIR